MGEFGRLRVPDRLVVPRDAPRRVVALAARAQDLDAAHRHLRRLTDAGHTVVLIWWQGSPGSRLRSVKARRQLTRQPARRPRAVARRVRSATSRTWWAERGTLLAALRDDARAQRLCAEADALLLLGDEARDLADRLPGLVDPAPPLVPQRELAFWRELDRTWTDLAQALADGVETDAGLGRELLRRITLAGGSVPTEHQGLLAPVVRTLHDQGELALAGDLAGHLDPETAPTPEERARRRGLRALVATSATGREAPDLRAAVSDLLRWADAALDEEDVEGATDGAALALELLFHRELHADDLSSPLVTDPDGFLAVWRSSRVGRTLARSTRARADRDDGRDQGPQGYEPSGGPGRGVTERLTSDRPRVLVSPGTFPQFSPPVVEALRARAEVEVVELSARTSLRWLGVSRELVGRRLRHALGEPVELDLELLTSLERADAVLVDWADRGALELLMTALDGLPITLRVHSMDALSAWVHLLDWGRVDDLVVVSEHMRRLMHALLGDRLAGTRVHVVPNVVQADRFHDTKTEGHRRRLVVVGWGQVVKDPLWALEVLALLRADDPSWHLTFLGADFLRGKYVSSDHYMTALVERLVQDDVRDAVDFVGWTEDIAPHLARAGFVISASRRESFGIGVMEAAGSGAVPVVRDWPVFAALDGARSVAPEEWVVGTVAEAADRIRGLAEEPEWTRASDRARQEVRDRYVRTRPAETLCAVVLGAGRTRASVG